MSEGALWKEIRPMLKGPNTHVSRVESHSTSPGFPDVDICWDFVEFKVELKYGDDKKPPEVRDTQVKWINKRIRVGGKVMILAKLIVGDDTYYAFYRGEHINQLYRCKKTKDWLKVPGIFMLSLSKDSLMFYLTKSIS